MSLPASPVPDLARRVAELEARAPMVRLQSGDRVLVHWGDDDLERAQVAMDALRDAFPGVEFTFLHGAKSVVVQPGDSEPARCDACGHEHDPEDPDRCVVPAQRLDEHVSRVLATESDPLGPGGVS